MDAFRTSDVDGHLHLRGRVSLLLAHVVGPACMRVQPRLGHSVSMLFKGQCKCSSPPLRQGVIRMHCIPQCDFGMQSSSTLVP